MPLVLKLARSVSEILERKILEIIKDVGDKGIIQREIWKKINVDSRKGIKIIKRLERMGLLEREPLIQGGRKTYILRPTPKVFKKIRLPEFLEDIPCFYCPYLHQCGSGEHDLYSCKIIDKWIKEKILRENHELSEN